MNATWKKNKPRLYFYNSDKATGEVFGAPSPLMRWAWAVYWEKGHDNGVCGSFEGARNAANDVIIEAEAS